MAEQNIDDKENKAIETDKENNTGSEGCQEVVPKRG